MLFQGKQKSRWNWGSNDLSSKKAVKLNLLQNYLSNFNHKLDNGLNQD